ncbi:hypothetical protein [Breoghania sp. L-A4]|uniref:hypothetical protein n=1 Tax=Breoghania sp. L-A4 TaxID=2304600 RepID=UPI000E35EB4F|nr:hypothetical protein [Breoghania sp. L-A4]AXS41841.1 hypothetical protein D1F64_19800 [Breoghania sp. L-A4]
MVDRKQDGDLPDKQAVIVIHGMGEQKAMDTLRGFVDVVWSGDERQRPYGGGPQVWSKPDTISDALELRRLTTNHNFDGVRTDFFEFYWAHLMSGTKISHVVSWVKLLLFRNRKDVPDQLYAAWIALWVLCGLITLLVVDLSLDEGSKFLGLTPFWTMLIGAVLLYLNTKIIAPIIGDAARYLSPAPVNVGQRRAIRDEGATLLRKLIECGDYRRIIVVGHSLGSIIGYDILRDVWAEYNTRMAGDGPSDALDRLQALANTRPLDREAYREAQRDYLDELRANGNKWCVSDFITMGSPLAHGNALLARTFDEFDERVAQREFPVCPPLAETDSKGTARFSYDRTVGKGEEQVRMAVPHHAAVFAPVRWTNIYFPCRNIIEGDLIGGPIEPVFGEGVEDVAVTPPGNRYLAHTRYWTIAPGGDRHAPGAHIIALREALKLAEDRPEQPQSSVESEPVEPSGSRAASAAPEIVAQAGEAAAGAADTQAGTPIRKSARASSPKGTTRKPAKAGPTTTRKTRAPRKPRKPKAPPSASS